MWWGELYLVFALVSVGLAVASRALPAKLVAPIVVAQYIVANLLHDNIGWHGGLNLLFEFLFWFVAVYLCVHRWHWLVGYVCLLLSVRLFIHAGYDWFEFNRYVYAATLNCLFALELLGLAGYSTWRVVYFRRSPKLQELKD